MIRRLVHGIAHSLSARLLGIFLLTAIVYGVASRYAVELVLNRDYLRDMVGAYVSLNAAYLVRDLGSPPNIEHARAITDVNPMDIRIEGPGIDWASDRAFPDAEEMDFDGGDFTGRVRELLLRSSAPYVEVTDYGFARYQDHSFSKIEFDDYRIMLVTPKLATEPGPSLTAPIIALISILVLAGFFLAVTWLIRPIKWIKEGADRIRMGELDYRIPVTRSDDLGELIRDINLMAEDVQEMLEAKQQMLLAISHELRSPLTRTRVALELIEDDHARQGILEDVTEMERLISDLLESERLNTRHSKLQLSETDLVELARETVEVEFTRERDRIRLELPAGAVRCRVDETRIRLLVKNLVDNALSHTRDRSAPVIVTVGCAETGPSISVTDSGAGMSAEQAARATEPFYRADPARCRDTGGVGLGLYLCRRIAEAHGGSLEIRSHEGQGTEVALRLPKSVRVGV